MVSLVAAPRCEAWQHHSGGGGTNNQQSTKSSDCNSNGNSNDESDDDDNGIEDNGQNLLLPMPLPQPCWLLSEPPPLLLPPVS